MCVIFGVSSLPHTIVSLITEYDADFGLLTLPNGVDLTYMLNLLSHWYTFFNTPSLAKEIIMLF